MVEILAAIAIIGILLAILFLAFGDVGASAKIRQTKGTFATLKAVEAEFVTTGNLRDVEFTVFGGNDKRLPAPTNGMGSDVGKMAQEQVVVATRQVLAHFQRNTKVKDMLGKVPQESMLDLKTGDPNPNLPRPLIDSWGHPIILVPSGGLSGVKIGSDSNWIVTSTGTYQNSVPTAQAPQLRPFWASAGKDGNFSTGDDNVYSFQD
jgi:type II secretory pathway pseudopilin PulG